MTRCSCKGIAEGVTAVEALAYRRLTEPLAHLRCAACAASVAAPRTRSGRGFAPAGWASRCLPPCPPEAAYGAALLALPEVMHDAPRTTLPELAAAYDAFLIDQFGVLLDGAAAYPGTRRAGLAGHRQTGDPAVELGKRSAPNAAQLDRLAFAATAIGWSCPSGEAALRIWPRGWVPGTPVWLHAREGTAAPSTGWTCAKPRAPRMLRC